MSEDREDIDPDKVIKHLKEILGEYENSANITDQMLVRRSITLYHAIDLIEYGEIVKGQIEAAESLMEFNDEPT